MRENLITKIGKRELILIESNKFKTSFGKDQNFRKVKIEKEIEEGKIILGTYTGIEGDTLLAKIA